MKKHWSDSLIALHEQAGKGLCLEAPGGTWWWVALREAIADLDRAKQPTKKGGQL